MNTYWRLLGFAKPLEKFAIPYFFFTLLYAFFNTFNFVMFIPILSTLFGTGEGAQVVTVMPAFSLSIEYLKELVGYAVWRYWGGQAQLQQVLVLLAGVVLTSALLSNLFRYLGQRTIETMRIRTLQKLRDRVYDNVMGMHVGFFGSERKGDIISKISSDMQVVQFCITNTLQVVFRDPFLIIGYLVALVAISWKLTIFAGLFLPVAGLVIGSIVKRLKRKATKAQETFADMVSLMDESITGVKIIKAYNATDYIRAKFRELDKKFSRLSIRIARRQQLASPMSEFLGITAVAVILIYGGSLVGAGSLDPAGFIAYLGIFSQITRPVRTFMDAFANINQGIAAGERVFELLDARSEITDAADAVELGEFNDSIELRDVRFSYDASKEVIGGVSLTIRKGETVALVGASGGGKSTISDLIPRFWEVTGGEIRIDGVDIRGYTLESLRAQMGVVAQETILFNDTIEQNIRLGKRDATMADIEHAARVANAHDFILQTENGYQTNIGDRGMKLSGGQRQRLSIARAVLKNPAILILDEATSALDTQSEKLVQGALEKLLEGRTSLVIAHRLSTIQGADRILVVDGGRIVEEGSHEELLGRGGVYAKLISLQQA